MIPMSVRLVFVLVAIGAWFGLAVLGRGGVDAFFGVPALVALAWATLAISVASLFVGGNLSPGLREDRGNRWVLTAFAVIGFADAFLPAWADGRGLWRIGGDGVRWCGVVLFVAGGLLRLWPVVVLGHRFSGLVAIQPGHRLVTTGVYRVIRHPSYLGLLGNGLGWGLAFDTWMGVLVVALLLPPLLARIAAEERLLLSEFGAEYEAFRARTWRLVPGIF